MYSTVKADKLYLRHFLKTDLSHVEQALCQKLTMSHVEQAFCHN